METYLISQSEYPEDGCYAIEATSEKDAVKQWAEETGTKPEEMPDLVVTVATPILLALHAADEAREAANAAYEAIRKVADAELAAARERRHLKLTA